MSKPSKRIPEGYHTLTPHLSVRGAARAIDFYKKAFGAVEVERTTGPDGKAIMHAELRIGDSPLLLHDEFPESGGVSPTSLEGSPVTLHMFVEDADAVFNRAVAAGAKVSMPMSDQFWGDRYGQVTDPFGHNWSIAHRLESLSLEEKRRRAAELFGG